MRVNLIVARLEQHPSPLYAVEGAWDEDCLDGNRQGYNANMDAAASAYGWRNVREVCALVDEAAVRDLFNNPAVEPARRDVTLVWRIEDGVLEVVDAWNDDTMDSNPSGFAEAVAAAGDARLSSHSLDWAEVDRAFQPPTFNLT